MIDLANEMIVSFFSLLDASQFYRMGLPTHQFLSFVTTIYFTRIRCKSHILHTVCSIVVMILVTQLF
jgi:hypothetical protein